MPGAKLLGTSKSPPQPQKARASLCARVLVWRLRFKENKARRVVLAVAFFLLLVALRAVAGGFSNGSGVVSMFSGVRVFGLCFLGLVGLVAGCGPTNSNKPPPNGGEVIAVPGRKGFVEVVKKKGPSPITAEVSFYFYKDAFTPYDFPPESGVLLLEGNRKVALEVDGDALVTPTGPTLFEGRDVEGIVSVELNGDDVKIQLGEPLDSFIT